MKKVIPNFITISRIIFAFPAALSLFFGFNEIFILFVIYQAIMDKTDGVLARRWNVASDSGRMLDTIADILFFVLIVIVMFFVPEFHQFLVLYIPGIIIGFVAIVWWMIKRKKFKFPRRPIDHISFILYVNLIILVIASFDLTYVMSAIGGAVILLGSILLIIKTFKTNIQIND